MTRRKPPPMWAASWYPGEPGEVSRANVLVPQDIRDRYGATMDIVEPPDSATMPTVLLVTVTDRDTGAIAEVRGARITLPADGTVEYLARLGRDARRIAGGAARGRRPRGTDVTDEGIRRAVAELRKAGRTVGLDSIAATSGVFSPSQLRYWLRVNGRHLSDYR